MPDEEDIAALAGERARNLFETGQLLCSEAVLAVLNEALRGGLDPQAAVRLTSGLPEGMGGSGCTCGALTGSVLALGLFLGRDGPGIGNSKQVMQASQALHGQFKKRFGSTCCRVLSKDQKICADLTAFAAESAARIILEKRPRLALDADRARLAKKDSRLGAGMRRLAGLLPR